MIADDFIRESATTYHETTGYVSSHKLIEFWRCPYTYRQRELGLVQPVMSPAFEFGRAAHIAVLEGCDVYDDEVVVGGPINPKTGNPYGRDTKAFAEWAATQNGIIVSDEEDTLIRRMVASVKAHRVASGLMKRGLAERVIRRSMWGIPCQCRLDWITEIDRQLTLVDFKTCEELERFDGDIARFAYARQLAFYQTMLAQHLQVLPSEIDVFIVAVEKREPTRVGVWHGSDVTMREGRQWVETALSRYATCVKENSWPSAFDVQRVF